MHNQWGAKYTISDDPVYVHCVCSHYKIVFLQSTQDSYASLVSRLAPMCMFILGPTPKNWGGGGGGGKQDEQDEYSHVNDVMVERT